MKHLLQLDFPHLDDASERVRRHASGNAEFGQGGQSAPAAILTFYFGNAITQSIGGSRQDVLASWEHGTNKVGLDSIPSPLST